MNVVLARAALFIGDGAAVLRAERRALLLSIMVDITISLVATDFANKMRSCKCFNCRIWSMVREARVEPDVISGSERSEQFSGYRASEVPDSIGVVAASRINSKTSMQGTFNTESEIRWSEPIKPVTLEAI